MKLFLVQFLMLLTLGVADAPLNARLFGQGAFRPDHRNRDYEARMNNDDIDPLPSGAAR